MLRKRAKPVKEINASIRATLSKMAQIMYNSRGIGLAANQIGLDACLIVVDAGSGLYKLVNPKIIKREGIQVNQEGCLSLPGVCIKVKRAKKILLNAQDENANPITLEAQDLFACVLQHEIDHLRGRLIIDYASFFERMRIRKKIEEIKRRSKNENLSKSETKSRQLQL